MGICNVLTKCNAISSFENKTPCCYVMSIFEPSQVDLFNASKAPATVFHTTASASTAATYATDAMAAHEQEHVQVR